MDTVLRSHYQRAAEAYDRGPQLYGGDAGIAALRCFRAYHPQAHITWDNGRWMTQKQVRVYGVLARLSVSGEHSTIRAIAQEIRACPSTVSRAILKMQAWGDFAVDVSRGRYGGIRVWKPVGDRFALYAKAARQKLREIKQRAFNVASTLREKVEGVSLPTTHYGRNIKTFTESVVYARAYLALDDPDGEYEAIRPMTREQAIKALEWKERKPAEVWAEEEQRLLEKATEEGDVDLVHRIHVDRQMRALARAGSWDKWQALADLLYPEHVH